MKSRTDAAEIVAEVGGRFGVKVCKTLDIAASLEVENVGNGDSFRYGHGVRWLVGNIGQVDE